MTTNKITSLSTHEYRARKANLLAKKALFRERTRLGLPNEDLAKDLEQSLHTSKSRTRNSKTRGH